MVVDEKLCGLMFLAVPVLYLKISTYENTHAHTHTCTLNISQHQKIKIKKKLAVGVTKAKLYFTTQIGVENEPDGKRDRCDRTP